MPKISPVFFYVPNIIDYIRILLLLISCLYMSSDYHAAIFFYASSQGLDALDGMLARLLNQCSHVGVVLDMLIDRISTLCLYIYLGVLYQRWYYVFQILAALDIFSHWAAIYMSATCKKASHKSYTKQENPILYFYYSTKTVLGTVCVGNELFLILIYAVKMCQKSNDPRIVCSVFKLFAVICFPIFFFKQLTSVMQLAHALQKLAVHKTDGSPNKKH